MYKIDTREWKNCPVQLLTPGCLFCPFSDEIRDICVSSYRSFFLP